MTPKEIERAKFWSRVKIPGGRWWKKQCWEWQGALTTDVPRGWEGGWGGGYGQLRVGGTWWRAHRYAWTLYRGRIPDHKVIGHTCDNRKCVNPAHLELVTLSENLQHAHDRGRTTGKQKGRKTNDVPF